MPDRIPCDLCGQPADLLFAKDFVPPNGFCRSCRRVTLLKNPEPRIPGVTKEMQITWRGVRCSMFLHPSPPGHWVECYIRLSAKHPWLVWPPTRIYIGKGIAARQPDTGMYVHFSVLAARENMEAAKWTALRRMIDRAKLVWIAGCEDRQLPGRVEDGRYIRERKVENADRRYRELLEEDLRNTHVHIEERLGEGRRVHRGR